MDISLCIYNSETKKLAYSGANNPILIIKKESFELIPATKNPIGLYYREVPFEKKEIQLDTDDMIYMYTDGYADQFNGVLRRKLKTKYFREILISLRNRTAEKQKQELTDFLRIWKGDSEQIDDIMVLGVRV